MKITILGCGASSGVPLIGCDCVVCRSGNPKNTRRRVSVLVEQGDAVLLIDTSPDLRSQIIDNNITRLDGVLYTHEHADHSHGIDELRNINRMMQAPVHAYGDARTMELLQQRFAYAFTPPNKDYGWYKAVVEAHVIEPGKRFTMAGVDILPFSQTHGKIETLGFRIGDFAYSTDVNALDDEAFKALEGVDTWVVDAQGYRKAFVHSHVEQTLEWIERVKPRRAILTHMSHELDYDTLASALPEGVQPAFDNMVITLTNQVDN